MWRFPQGGSQALKTACARACLQLGRLSSSQAWHPAPAKAIGSHTRGRARKADQPSSGWSRGPYLGEAQHPAPASATKPPQASAAPLRSSTEDSGSHLVEAQEDAAGDQQRGALAVWQRCTRQKKIIRGCRQGGLEAAGGSKACQTEMNGRVFGLADRLWRECRLMSAQRAQRAQHGITRSRRTRVRLLPLIALHLCVAQRWANQLV